MGSNTNDLDDIIGSLHCLGSSVDGTGNLDDDVNAFGADYGSVVSHTGALD